MQPFSNRSKLLLFFAFLLVISIIALSWQSPTSARGLIHWHWDVAEKSARAELAAPGPLSGIPCTAGFAGPYPCKDVDLAAYLPMNALVGSSTAAIWGWTDPVTGHEITLLGHGSAVSFIDVTDPYNPVVLGELPAPVPNVLWRELKVYNNHVYLVGDGDFVQPHGLQIFDLTQLRDVTNPPVVFSTTARHTSFGHAHNIAINEATATAYIVGSNKCAGGLYMLDLTNPLNPVPTGCFSQDGYTHDTLCVIYRGPDVEHQGKEICFASNEDTLTIVDVTNRAAPLMLSRTTYTDASYTHQGWLTEDMAYFVLGDEYDEIDNLYNYRSYIWNLADLDAPVHFSTYIGPNTAIDHNLFILGNYVYESNYTAGLRILDAKEIAQGTLTEVAYFDTHPSDNATAFAGTWGNYPFFKSGIVVVSNIEDGLFVLVPKVNQPVTGEAAGGGWLAGKSGGKLNFSFLAEQNSTDGASGEMKLHDKAAGVKIDVSTITELRDGSACGDLVTGDNRLEILGEGTFNGSPASFRACVADNGEPGKGADSFYLACLDGCSYNTGSSAKDATIDAGNIEVETAGGDGESGAAEARTLQLDPILASEGLAGSLQLLTVKVYDQNQEQMVNASVTLTALAADGSQQTLTALTHLSGVAVFSVVNLAQAVEYSAAAGGIESNTVEISPVGK